MMKPQLTAFWCDCTCIVVCDTGLKVDICFVRSEARDCESVLSCVVFMAREMSTMNTKAKVPCVRYGNLVQNRAYKYTP
jgi:hypothetical protein